MFASDEKINRLLQVILSRLNLKAHYAGLVPPTKENIEQNKVRGEARCKEKNE